MNYGRVDNMGRLQVSAWGCYDSFITFLLSDSQILKSAALLLLALLIVKPRFFRCRETSESLWWFLPYGFGAFKIQRKWFFILSKTLGASQRLRVAPLQMKLLWFFPRAFADRKLLELWPHIKALRAVKLQQLRLGIHYILVEVKLLLGRRQ
jgi:hypothetical protein